MVGVREEELQISITHSELSAVAVCVVRPAEHNPGVTP
jgi:phosphopantetheinyl transferase (holo-ACP synthase)